MTCILIIVYYTIMLVMFVHWRSFLLCWIFLVLLIFFITGFVVNRVADAQLICLRNYYKDSEYKVPMGCCFCCISAPNYLGEIIEWFGWMLMMWSLSGFVWLLFVIATHVPRARQNHIWNLTIIQNDERHLCHSFFRISVLQ